MKLQKFASGAVRGTDRKGIPLELIPLDMLKLLAKAFQDGIDKGYPKHNWKKGIPNDDLLNHAINHLYLYLEGDTSEDHLSHAMWNIGVAGWNEKNNKAMVNVGPNAKKAK